jgi:hypothetical protein
MEHMLREPVHAAFLEDSAWNTANADVADTTEVHLSGRDGVAACIAEWMERSRPTDGRLVRVHDHLWLRIWLRGGARHPMRTRDIVLPLRGPDTQDPGAELIRSS